MPFKTRRQQKAVMAKLRRMKMRRRVQGVYAYVAGSSNVFPPPTPAFGRNRAEAKAELLKRGELYQGQYVDFYPLSKTPRWMQEADARWPEEKEMRDALEAHARKAAAERAEWEEKERREILKRGEY